MDSELDTRPCDCKDHCNWKKDKDLCCDKKDKDLDDKKDQDCDCDDVGDIIACICQIDKKIKCIQDALGHSDAPSKQKIATCIILQEIEKIESKVDKLVKCCERTDKIECKLDKVLKCLDCCDD